MECNAFPFRLIYYFPYAGFFLVWLLLYSLLNERGGCENAGSQSIRLATQRSSLNQLVERVIEKELMGFLE